MDFHLFFEAGSQYVAQIGFKFTMSCLSFLSAGFIGIEDCTQLEVGIRSMCFAGAPDGAYRKMGVEEWKRGSRVKVLVTQVLAQDTAVISAHPCEMGGGGRRIASQLEDQLVWSMKCSRNERPGHKVEGRTNFPELSSDLHTHASRHQQDEAASWPALLLPAPGSLRWKLVFIYR